MEWGTPVQWGRFLLFCVHQSVKTKETYPTRPGSPTPCKQGLSQSISQSVSQSVSQQVNDFGQKLQISFLFVLGKKQALRQCLTIIQSENQSSQTIKILIFNSGHIVFSQTGQPTILVEKWKFHLCMFLAEWTLKYCLTIIEVENTPSQTIKCWILQSCHAEIFTQGLIQDFGQKLQISFLFAFFWGGGGGGGAK